MPLHLFLFDLFNACLHLNKFLQARKKIGETVYLK